jgi:hypothetical protein
MEGACRLLDEGRRWQLGSTLDAGGAVLFPHAGIATCGHQIAAAVHACLDCGADHILALGVLHATTPELRDARERVAAGGDPATEASWGIQGPGLTGRSGWEGEFSLSHFGFLLEKEARRRGRRMPRVVARYPFLAGGCPERLPGIRELEHLVPQAAIVATGDLVHHGIGYGDSPQSSMMPERGGLDLARRYIENGLTILRNGTPREFHDHCVHVKSDARDVGQVLRHLLGPLEGRVLDLLADDMSDAYGADRPTWVACALVELRPSSH